MPSTKSRRKARLKKALALEAQQAAGGEAASSSSSSGSSSSSSAAAAGSAAAAASGPERERPSASAPAGSSSAASGSGSAPKRKRPSASVPAAAPAPAPAAPKRPVSALQAKMAKRLKGAQFRLLNEHLYTSSSSAAVERMDASEYNAYHEGFASQVESWPVNPLDLIATWIKASHKPPAAVADLGCGEARLALEIPNKCHSFDLVQVNDRITVCDIAAVPLPDGAVDVAVFCLSLMGTNRADFVREAHRVLAPAGVLKVAEVRSRFDKTPGGIDAFVREMGALGFKCVHKDTKNKMFVITEFVKRGDPDAKAELGAAPCIYKRR